MPMKKHNANNNADTIAGLATAAGTGAIAIIRVSGPASLKIADLLFKNKKHAPSSWLKNHFAYGHLIGQDGIFLDEAILLVMRAPYSYTKEDVIEFQIHGGPTSARRVLKAIFAAGARPAEPGEFTKRAFLNGRLDLVQAEAVMDLITASTTRAASLATEQLAGTLSVQISKLYDDLLSSSSELEAFLDFLDDEIPSTLTQNLLANLKRITNQFQNLLINSHEGRIIRDGALVVISGKPNTGKSTLMNALLGHTRSIVSPIPGTTRDFIEETLVLDGFLIRLVDTAGLRNSDCSIEQQGVEHALSWIKKADLHLHVVDLSITEQPFDEQLLNYETLTKQNIIVVMNKKDLAPEKLHDNITSSYKTVYISALHNDGIINLKKEILQALQLDSSASFSNIMISERHANLISNALNNIEETTNILQTQNESGYVPAAIHMKKAAETIASIIGCIYDTDLLNSVFSKFCIGK